jgi:hypothetical protein
VIAVQAAADAAPSAMVSVIGLDSDKVAALCDAANEEVSEDERVQIANFLCPVSWPIYLFCCFSFTSGVVIGVIHIYVKVPMVLLYEEHCSLAASMNLVRKFSVVIIQLLKWNKKVMLIMLLSQFDRETMQC